MHFIGFTIEAVSHLFEHDICVGILAGMLALSGDFIENFVDIGQIEIPAEA